LWQAKYIRASNLYKLLQALSEEFKRIDYSVYALASEFIPSFNMGFVEEWERFLGIPDDCLSIDTILEIRRANILAKLGFLNLFSEQDYHDLAALYGLTIVNFDNLTFGTINITIGGTGSSPPLNVFDMTFDPLLAPQGAFIFGSIGEDFFRCLVKTYSPAFVQVNLLSVSS
jgi:hypothetical protein